MEIMEADEIPIFPDTHRNMECRHALALKLKAKQKVFFEGVSVQYLEGVLGIHVNQQNDSIPGYNWSSVVSMKKDGSCSWLTINDYSRKCGNVSMKFSLLAVSKKLAQTILVTFTSLSVSLEIPMASL